MIKKLLVSLIVAAMLVTLVPMFALAEETTTATTPTVPYSDIFGTPFESVFIKLHLMGIFTGYPDQTFKPDRQVTRSEFLAVTIRALNFEKYVAGFKGATKYPDTAIDHWATGYINMGTAFGIVKGYPDGTFKPDSNVTYAEACTMLVRMLGYTQYLTPVTPGGGTEDWFANFVKMAVAMGDPSGYGLNVHEPDLVLPDGILTGVTAFNASSPASRGDLAIMVYNSLFVYPLTQWEWTTQGPVPGGIYFPSGTTLIGNMGFHEMETFVTDAPPYDAYAGASQIELFEGWTTVVDGAEVFVPCTEDPRAFAAANGLKYPDNFKPVHRLYDIPAASIWVGGKPADLTSMIGKPVRVIYQGPVPYVGQEPFKSPSKLWYVKILPHQVQAWKVGPNQIGSYWFPGKTVGEIFADLKLKVYPPTTPAKTLSTITLDPRAVIFLEDVFLSNPNVMLVKDADITVIRGFATKESYRDYEGHPLSEVVTSDDVWAILAKVWPGHIVKDALVSDQTAASYDIWGRVEELGEMTFSFTDDDTFNHRLPTPYPTFAESITAWCEDDAKFVLDGGAATVLDEAAAGYVGTVRLAPVKSLTGESRFSVIHFEGLYSTGSGTLEEIYRTKDQWGNDWVTSIKVGGKVYEVLFPGRGEAPVIAASTTGTLEEPTAPVGEVGGVESGATFFSESGDELVFNNLWDEREYWLGLGVDLQFNKDGKVRLLSESAVTAPTAFLDYGLVTRANMVSDSTGYHLSIDIMKGDGSIANYPLSEFTDTAGVTWLYWNFSWYNDHNRGVEDSAVGHAAITNYAVIYDLWQKLQNLVRDVVKLTKVTVTNVGDVLKIEELSTNGAPYQSTNTEGLIDEVGPVFDGTTFSLENTNREQLVWNFPAAFWKPSAVSGDKTTQWLAAKDLVTVPWASGTIQQPGTVIYDATLPAPNVPTPDGNILIKKMADLQRDQFVQVFFQPVPENANPYMCDWMLVNGQYVPVVKFIVIRPLMAGPLANVAESPAVDALSILPVNSVWKQFNQSLDAARSTMWIYNTTAGAFVDGDISFGQVVYPNDKIIFTPDRPLTDGVYLVNVTGYDAATGGTQSLNFYWRFTVALTVYDTTIQGTVIGPEGPMGGVGIEVTPFGATDTTGIDGTYSVTFQSPSFADATVTIPILPPAPPGSTWEITYDPAQVFSVGPLGGTFTCNITLTAASD